MSFAALKKLLTNNDRYSPEHPEYRRVYLLNVTLLLYVVVAAVFAVLNAIPGNYTLMLIQAVFAVLSLAVLIYFRKTDRFAVCAHVSVFTMVAVMLFMFVTAGHMHYILAWMYIFPPVTFFLLGRKKAVIVTAGVLAIFLILILRDYGNWQPVEFNHVSIINILTSAILLVLLIWYFELSRSEAAEADQSKNRALEEANLALIESTDRLRLILDSTAEAVFGMDVTGRCTFCNTSCLEMLGMKNEEELLGKDIHELLHSRHMDGTPIQRTQCSIIRTCMEGAPAHSDDEVFWRSNGTCFDVAYNSYPQYKNGALIGAVVTFTDNTLKKIHEQQIEYFSTHDSLTGLYNRSHFEYLLNKLDAQGNLPISVVMGDLNGLKLSNDVFSHNAGDELLVRAAEAIKKACREGDIIARLGGDEFVILLPKTQRQDAQQIMERIHEMLGQERSGVIRCSMSLGCDTKTAKDQKIDMTIQNAETEMYKEKALNRNKTDADLINALIMSLYGKNPPEELHSSNVSEMCRAIGEALGLPQTQLRQLRNAGYLHDIGKVGISEEILHKHGEFTDREEIEYRQHPVIGYRILNIFDSTMSLAESIYCHHEHWDGSGYPRGLSGDEIPLMARIIAVAGRFEVLINRYGEEQNDPATALEMIREDSGTRLEPALVDVFVKIMSEDLSLRKQYMTNGGAGQ